MAKAAITTPMPVRAGAGSKSEPPRAPRFGKRRLHPLTVHDLMRHVARDAVGDVGDVG